MSTPSPYKQPWYKHPLLPTAAGIVVLVVVLLIAFRACA
jgi:hypothetical protein